MPPVKIGITGGIGSGKSTVAKVFSCLGIPCYYADDRAKVLMTSEPIKTKVIEEFGAESYFENGELNRSFISHKVFDNSTLLEKLNSIVHPEVAEDFDKWVVLNADSKIVLKEAALLVENESYKKLDALIVVISNAETKLKRILKRDSHRSKEDIENIMSKQLPDSNKISHADFVINNNGESSVIDQVLKIKQALETKFSL